MSSDDEIHVKSGGSDENPWIRVVATLIKLTEKGKLNWKSVEPPVYFAKNPDHYVEAIFLADYKDKELRLYEENVREEESSFFSFGSNKSHWVRNIVLELADKSQYGWYRIPDVYALEDLLESVKYRIVGVDSFLNDLLSDEQS